KVNGYTTATIDKTETVRIEKENLAFAYYRSPDEGSVDNYHDLQSVFFTIPKEYSEKYGELEKVSAVWEECLSKPILIVNNKDIYNDFQEVLGKEVPDDFLYTFGYDLKFYDVGCYGFFTLKYLYKFDTIFNKNINLTEKPIPYNDNLHIFYSGSDTYYKNLIDKIYLAYFSKDVFSDEDKEIVTREELESDLDKYLWSDECFESIDKTNFESPVKFDNVKMNNFVYYRNPNFWEKLSGSNNKFNGQLPYTNLDKIDFEYLKSYNKEKFKEKYYVSSTEDYNSIKTLFESIIDKFTKKITADMYCLRFTVTPYITHKVYMFDNEGKHIDCDAMVVQPTAIRNFDFIDLTYNKNGVITIIPVVGSPQNTISGVTPNPNYAEPDPYAKILEFLEKILPVVLVLIVISIILRAYQIFKRPKIIIKEERKRKE
ncbi:MAG: hypothetical protein J6A53_03160, partial [Clostridia bacterium]|nr:hypothetical protein [Clostridia bacterium]